MDAKHQEACSALQLLSISAKEMNNVEAYVKANGVSVIIVEYRNMSLPTFKKYFRLVSNQ